MDHADSKILHARLERVEGRLRFAWAVWLASAVVVGTLGIAVQQATSQTDILRARGLEITDATGTVRIGLSVQPDGTAELAFFEPGGKGRMWIHVRPDGGPGLILADRTGTGRIWIAAYPDGSSGFLLGDPAGKGRIWLGASPDGTSGLVLVNQEGRVLFQAP